MREALQTLDAGMPGNPLVRIDRKRKKEGWITVTPFDPQPEPPNLTTIKAEIVAAWPMTNLLDILKEADLRLGFTEALKSSTAYETLDRSVLRPRLLLCLNGLGTNAGFQRMAGFQSGTTAKDLAYVRRRYITVDALRQAIAIVANGTLHARNPAIWGDGTTACASDSKHFGAWDQTLVAAIGVDVNGDKHPLGLVEGATENAATVQALIDNLVERGLDPAVPRLFIIDGSKALSKAIRATFGRDAAIQRCQIHKARNIMDRLPKSMHAQVRRVLRQAWEMDDADKAEKLLRNLARRLERDWEGVAASILEGLDEMLTVTKLGLPPELRRSLACTNIIENVMGTVRRVSRNVKYWRSPSMALRWAGAAMQEAAKGFRRLKAYKQLPLLQAALAVRKARATSSNAHLAQTTKAA